MRKQKHTPGPWVAGVTLMGDLAIFTAKGKHTLSGEAEKPLPLRQLEANARMQAASVEMYETLSKIVTLCDDGDADSWTRLAAKIAKQAMAKADGRG